MSFHHTTNNTALSQTAGHLRGAPRHSLSDFGVQQLRSANDTKYTTRNQRTS